MGARRQSFFLAFSITLATPLLAPAAPLSCSQIFSADSASFFSATLLKNKNFEIQGNTLVDKLNHEAVGVLQIIEAPYLYEWADADYQKIWMANGGLSEKDVHDNVLNSSQMLGRGYYVSIDPLDSHMYGPALSVFKTDGPMKILKAINHDYSSSISRVERLREAGIDGFSNGTTWINLISAKHLKAQKGKISDPRWDSAQSISSLMDDLETKRSLAYTKWLSSDLLYAKLITNRLRPDEIKSVSDLLARFTLKETVLIPKLSIELAKKYPQAQQIASEIPKHQERLMIQSLTNHASEDLVNVLSFSLGNHFMEEYVSKHPEKFNPEIQNLLKVYDVQEILAVQEHRHARFENFEELTTDARLFLQNMKKIDLHKIKDLQSFLAAGEKLTGAKLIIRDEMSPVSSDLKGDGRPFVPQSYTISAMSTLSPFFVKSTDANLAVPILHSSVGGYLRLKQLLSGPLVKAIQDFSKHQKLDDPASFQTPRGKKILRDFNLEIATLFMDRDKAFELTKAYFGISGYGVTTQVYQAFLGLRPFGENNEKIAHLYMRYYTKDKFDTDLDLPVTNMTVLTSTGAWPLYLEKSRFLSYWLSTAKNQSEFLQMIRTAYDVMKVDMQLASEWFVL
jgi:hypothetical protein